MIDRFSNVIFKHGFHLALTSGKLALVIALLSEQMSAYFEV